MADWIILGGLAAGLAAYASRGMFRQRHQEAAADAAGLVPVADLTHISSALQHTALWALADGGFERRVVHGVISAGSEDLELTVFDLETLRERRGEWASLPVEPPFRIAGVVSIAVAQVARNFGHVLLKRAGRGDELADDTAIERASSLAKLARTGLGVSRKYVAELPRTLHAKPLDVRLPPQWRAYGTDPVGLTEWLAAGFAEVLDRAGRRDLVIELIDDLVVIYPAARDVVGADAFADLAGTAKTLVVALLAASPRAREHPER